MVLDLIQFERVVRRASEFTDASTEPGGFHPFELRNIHQKLPVKCKALFDDGHFAQSSFEGCKYVDKEIQRLSKQAKSGVALVMSAFGGATPKIQINALGNQTELDEQEGFRFLFAGVMAAIRNPRGHEYTLEDDPDTCLDHLTILSCLLRKLEAAGFELNP